MSRLKDTLYCYKFFIPDTKISIHFYRQLESNFPHAIELKDFKKRDCTQK